MPKTRKLRKNKKGGMLGTLYGCSYAPCSNKLWYAIEKIKPLLSLKNLASRLVDNGRQINKESRQKLIDALNEKYSKEGEKVLFGHVWENVSDAGPTPDSFDFKKHLPNVRDNKIIVERQDTDSYDEKLRDIYYYFVQNGYRYEKEHKKFCENHPLPESLRDPPVPQEEGSSSGGTNKRKRKTKRRRTRKSKRRP